MKRPKLILSVDWDFFIEQDPKLEISNRESEVFLETLWAIRFATWKTRGETPEQNMPMTLSVPGFLNSLFARCNFPSASATAESHALIVTWLDKHFRGPFEIINFDAHHDIYYGKASGAELEAGRHSCENWAMRLLMDRKLEKYTVVYPDWRLKKGFAEGSFEQIMDLRCPAGMESRIRYDYWSNWAKKIDARRRPEGIFLCRSGCWSPPCYDQEFNRLARTLGGRRAEIKPRKIDAEMVNKLSETEARLLASLKRSGKQ